MSRSLTTSPLQSDAPVAAAPAAVGVLRWEAGGYPVGLEQLESLIGNSTNVDTYDFPVLFDRVPGANLQSVVLSPSQSVLQSMILSGKRLIASGAKAITTSCGFNAVFQRELASALDVPVFTSSLLQIPIIRAIYGENARILVITASGASLTAKHFEGAGVFDLEGIHTVGLEENREWRKIFEAPEAEIDIEVFRSDLAQLAMEQVTLHQADAVLLECTDLPPFADDIRQATGIPVFDYVTLLYYVQHAAIGQYRE